MISGFERISSPFLRVNSFVERGLFCLDVRGFLAFHVRCATERIRKAASQMFGNDGK